MPDAAIEMAPEEKAIRRRLRDDLAHYAARCLHIRSKTGKVEPLAFNRAQRHLHFMLEDQLARLGRVRALILKGRQQGASTYVGARFYHQATHRSGCRVFILTHEQEATDNLFGMVERYHDHCPELVKPATGYANAKELSFVRLDSGYKVGTAGTKATGRSQTIQLLHGSEVAHWPNADSHFAGVVQAVPDIDGTEIILESTANGLGNRFHQMWQDAEAGKSDYIAIFIPWYWQEEYRKPPPDGFTLSDEEQEYQALYGLDLDQMAWKRAKEAELKDKLLFKQEYPATAAEAFQLTGHDSYIPPALVLRARKRTCEGIGPLVVGADPARSSEGDRFAVARRRGRKVFRVESRMGLDTTTGAGWLKQIIDGEKPKKVFIDVGGNGAGVYDIVKSWGKPYSDIVVAVNFGGEPLEPPPLGEDGQPIGGGPRNRRAEMWMKSKDWLEDPAGADLPDSDSIQADATAPKYKYDDKGRLLLESKEHMRARKVRSPDEWDAIALTFAEPVADTTRRPPPGAGRPTGDSKVAY